MWYTIRMPVFLYSAADQKGAVSKGERDAENEKILAQTLKQEGLFLLEANLKETQNGTFASFDVGKVFSRLRPIRLVDKMFFARNLSVMIAAGLSLTKALEALGKQVGSDKFKAVITEVNDSVIKGKSFADSLRLHEGVFGHLFINMAEAGEASGKLPMVLRLVANQMKKDYEIRRRVRGAMIYPAIIIIVLIGIGTMMMVYVVPTVSQTIRELGVELPLSTRILVTTSDILVQYALLVVLGLAALVAGIWRGLRTETGKKLLDRVVLKLPVLSTLFKEFNVARFCRTLAYLITSGVPIVRALEITSSVLGNSFFRDAISRTSKDIQKGRQLHEILIEYPKLFDPVVVQMISVGEETGKISDMMLRLALFFESNVSHTTKNFSTIVEPVLMVFIGLVVGLFAISIFQPIYSSLGSI